MKHTSRTYWQFKLWRRYGGAQLYGWALVAASPITPNQNTDEGAVFFLDGIFETFNAYTAEWYVGLIVGDADPRSINTAGKITIAAPNPPTTNDWQEFLGYEESTRQLLVWNPAIDTPEDLPPNWLAGKQSLDTTFTISIAGEITGGFMCSSNGKGSTSGVLYAVDNGAGSLMAEPGDILQASVLSGFVNPPE